MDPLPQQRKEKKDRKVVTLLRMVLLLNCCRGAASEHEEDQNESHGTRHASNTEGTHTQKQKKAKKSFFKKSLGLFTKRSGKIGQDERRGDDSERNDGAGPSSQRDPPRSQTSTSDHETAFDWRLPGVPEETWSLSSAENCARSSTQDLHEPRPGPSQHEELQDHTVLFSVMDNVNKGPMVFSGCEEQSKTEVNVVTPVLPELKAEPSHLGDLQDSTITLPEKKSSSSSRKLSKVPEEIAVCIEDSSSATEETTDLPTPSNCHLLCFSFSIRKEKQTSWVGVTLLWMFLLLSCCTALASEHEEDQNELHRACTPDTAKEYVH
ncbi:hypothetical protein MHYP_G00224490 [Metynnis hypsauchen]